VLSHCLAHEDDARLCAHVLDMWPVFLDNAVETVRCVDVGKLAQSYE